MKRLKRLLGLLLIAALCAAFLPAIAAGVTLTAVNDGFLPLSSATMPTTKGGAVYVPYSVFTGTLGLTASYDSQQQTLVLQGTNTTLTFSMAQGYVYDQNMNSYSQPAYSINGDIYVPVKLVCGQFGLSYSSISSGSANVLRICNDNAVLSDRAFMNWAGSTIDEMLDEYTGGSKPGGNTTNPTTPTKPPEDPNVPEPVLPEEPITPAAVRPSLIYLSVYGAPNIFTPVTLDTLTSFEQKATFFLPEDTKWDGDQLRRIAGEGHAFGLMISASVSDLPRALDQANERLRAATGLTTRLVSVNEGSAALTSSQNGAVTAAGYRLWDPSLIADDETRDAARASRKILKALDGTTAPTMIRMHNAKASNATLTAILRDLRANDVPTARITLSDHPLGQ